MEKPMIGIRQADGSFYEIMGDAQTGHKRLVLSAARTDQHGVKIDLYRSTDSRVSPEGALGSIALDDPEGLGYQDIEFRVDLDAEGQLDASAQLPGQAPRRLSVDLTPFRSSASLAASDDLPPLDFDSLDSEPMTLDLPEVEDEPEETRRSDTDILGDEAFDLAEVDTLDEGFGDQDAEPPRRSDADILGDEAFASADLDTLDDFSFDDESPETRGLDDLSLPEEPAAPAAPAASFDLGDLDAGFGDEPAPPAEAADDWEKISLDDMEPMEFLDTGAEISSPTAVPAAPSRASNDEFRMDDDEPLELGDFDSDLSDLPDLGGLDEPPARAPAADDDSFGSFDNDLDQDFLPPPALTESSWDQDEEPVSAPAKAAKAPKAAKEPKPSQRTADRTAPAGDGSLDKVALLLSLAALSLLVLLILVLLFLNMIKAPQPPLVQPEVQRWTQTTMAAAPVRNAATGVLDLGAADPVAFEAQNVLEVPQALRGARVSLALQPGETTADATRRFGAPARVQGNQLSW